MTLALLFIASLLLPSLISAVPPVTPVQVGGGTCADFPTSFHGAGDNADAFIFVADQVDTSSISDLKASILNNELVVYDNSTKATVSDSAWRVTGSATIFCCDHGGTIEDGFGAQNLLLVDETGDGTKGGKVLQYATEGIKPLTYSHQVNATTLDGVFLGWANVTTWGFRRANAAEKEYYLVRLLVQGATLYDGEVKGFLKSLNPFPPVNITIPTTTRH